MKAFIFEKYGSPDVLELREIEKPTIGDTDLLVKVQAASANPLDWHRMRAAPFLVRFSDGLLKPKNILIGADIAGTVEAVGKNVTEFKAGDAVFTDVGVGGFAEYVSVAEDKLVRKPENISFEEAAAIPVAALTALQGLRDKGQLQAGQTVLVNGASGGVGTYGVQIAKAFGAEVTGVCSTRNLELVRGLGADYVIDYTQEDFSKNGRSYDLILDCVGNRSASAYKRALSPTGKCVLAGFTTIPHMLPLFALGALTSKFSDQEIGPMLAKVVKADLMIIAEMMERGSVKSVIDRCYPFNETPEAIRYLETGRARGKVIISMHENGK